MGSVGTILGDIYHFSLRQKTDGNSRENDESRD